MFSLFNCLEPETGYTISLSARWRSCFFELGALKECEGWDDGKLKKKTEFCMRNEMDQGHEILWSLE